MKATTKATTDPLLLAALEVSYVAGRAAEQADETELPALVLVAHLAGLLKRAVVRARQGTLTPGDRGALRRAVLQLRRDLPARKNEAPILPPALAGLDRAERVAAVKVAIGRYLLSYRRAIHRGRSPRGELARLARYVAVQVRSTFNRNTCTGEVWDAEETALTSRLEALFDKRRGEGDGLTPNSATEAGLVCCLGLSPEQARDWTRATR
jgi:hypothetical protein